MHALAAGCNNDLGLACSMIYLLTACHLYRIRKLGKRSIDTCVVRRKLTDDPTLLSIMVIVLKLSQAHTRDVLPRL